MRTWTRYSKGGAGLLLGVLAIAGDARAQGVTLVDAGTDQKAAAPSLPAVAPPPEPVVGEGDAIQLHSSRVSGTASLARALRASCAPALGLEETKAELERAVVRAYAARKGIDALEARRKKLEEEAVLAPRDGRIIGALALVARDKKNLEEAAKAEAKGKADLVSRDLATLGSSLCAELCAGKGTAESPVDFRAFSQPSLANAAAIADFGSVTALAGYVRQRLASIRVVLENKNEYFDDGSRRGRSFARYAAAALRRREGRVARHFARPYGPRRRGVLRGRAGCRPPRARERDPRSGAARGARLVCRAPARGRLRSGRCRRRPERRGLSRDPRPLAADDVRSRRKAARFPPIRGRRRARLRAARCRRRRRADGPPPRSASAWGRRSGST